MRFQVVLRWDITGRLANINVQRIHDNVPEYLKEIRHENRDMPDTEWMLATEHDAVVEAQDAYDALERIMKATADS